MTLRADFYDRPLRHRGFGELLRDRTEVITPMSVEELEAAIVGPVERLGVSYEPALLAELVLDVVDRTGALPLLQYALTELFDMRLGARITLASYRELGGVSGALAERAEGLLAELGTSASEVLRQVFLRLVTLGEGADDTRRRALRSELEQLAVDRQFLDSVVAAFGRHRLLSFDRDPVTRSPTVEISHEALLTEWDRLRGWIDAARYDVRNQRRLAEAMREWLSADRSDEYLLRGGTLHQLEGWSTTTSLPLSVPEQRFLDASSRERDRTRDEQRDHELRVASAEQRARRRIRQLTAMGVVAAIGAALAGFGIWQWRQARSASADLQALVRSTDLVERSESVLGADPEGALVLAIEALRSTVGLGYVTEDAVDAVHWALQENRTPYVVDDVASVVVRNGPAGRRGVFYLSPAELVAFADSTLDPGRLDRACRERLGAPCSATDIPAGLEPQFGVDAYTGRTSGFAGDLNGTVVTFAAGPLTTPGFDLDVQRFELRTGIDVRIVPSAADSVSSYTARELANYATAGWSMPDVARIVDLGNLVQFNDRIEPVELGSYIDANDLERRFGPYLLGLGTVDGSIDAVPIQLAAGGLIYFRRDAFEQAGYSVPTSWDELMSLARRMVDDDETPWCLAFDAGPSQPGDSIDWDGRPGSDLLNDLVLRSAGVELYDSWTRHEIPFDAPPILEAGRLLEQLLFEDGFVADTDEVASLDAAEAFARLNRRHPVTSDPDPGCWLYPQDGIRLERNRSFEIGSELDFFEMPTIDQNLGSVANGDAAFAVQLSDRPEVRRFMEFLASSEWGVQQALEGTSVPPHSGFPISVFGRDLDERASDAAHRMAAGVRAALEADRWRVDASQLRPSEIGSYDGLTRSALFSGMTDMVRGRRTIGEVLADTEAVWIELEAEAFSTGR